MTKNLIRLENVSLSYRFLQKTKLKTLLSSRQSRRMASFQALKDISISVNTGQNMGIIGSNGSGKSTLLRIIGHTLIPDTGSVHIGTNSISLISLGVGFKPDLSGMENIYINGLLLGLSKKQIDDKLQDIIEFAEIGDFVNSPVRTYSSGMKSKLMFSIATNVDPELLLIDEVFSVGDESFKRKSRERLESMILDERTVIMVSHNMATLKQYCDSIIWIESGRVRRVGNVEDIVDEYLKYMETK